MVTTSSAVLAASMAVYHRPVAVSRTRPTIGEMAEIFLEVSCIGSISLMRCMTKPAINMLGAPRVGIRLHTRFVYSENTCTGLMALSASAKQLTSDLLIFSMLCQSRRWPLGNVTPSDARTTVTVERPKSGDISTEGCDCCLALSRGSVWM